VVCTDRCGLHGFSISSLDLISWPFPLWWVALLRILKSWADRVFAMGRTYGGERFYENGLFKG
jgi:NAD(P)H dehydrogenase (quinone)